MPHISFAKRAGPRAAATLLLLAAACALQPPLAAGSEGQTWVPYPKLLAAARTGPLIRTIINPARMDVEIKFRNLDEWHAYYPPGAEQQLSSLMRARRVHVIYVPRPKAAAARTTSGGHPLRWALIAVAAAALLAGGALLLRRRRR